MSKTVIDRNAQQEVDVSSAEAQQAVLRGDAALTEGTQTVVKGSQLMDVPTVNLAEAVARGWTLVDDEEAASVQLRNEESDAASLALGATESLASGLSLGLYSSAAEALGADPERMAARREALGDVGTLLEVGGAALPAAFTGGSSLAGTAGGAATRGGARALLRSTPAGLLERGAAALEGRAAQALAKAPGMVRTVVPVAGRGAAEGFVSGAGAQLHEDVLGDREVSVDRLLGAGGMGALFGGGVGALVPGVSGAVLAGTKLPREAAGKVLRRATGVLDEVASGESHILEKALADGNAPMLAKVLGVPEESVAALLPDLRAKAGRAEIDDLLQEGGSRRAEETLAAAAREPVEDLVESVSTLKQAMGRKGKAKREAASFEPERAEAAARTGAQQVDAFASSVDSMIAKNAEMGGELYHKGTLTQMKAFAERARAQVNEAAKSGGPQDIALAAYRSLDELKQDADVLMSKVRKSVERSGDIAADNTLDAFAGTGEQAGPIGAIRQHLEDEQVWGGLATGQREQNAAARAAIEARKSLADGATKRLLDGRRGFVDNRDLLSLMRSSGRFRGEQITENFREVVRREIAAAEAVAKHNQLSPEQAAVLAKAKGAEAAMDAVFAKQRRNIERLDAIDMIGNVERNGSAAAGAFSSPATVLGPILGGAIGGLPGAAVGYVASMASKPYTILRKYSAIMRQIDKGEAGQIAAVAGFINKMGKGAAKAARAAAPYGAAVGRAGRTAATRGAAISAAQRRKRNDDALEKAQYYASNPTALAEDMRGMTLNMEDVAPSMSGLAAQRAADAAAFLVSKAPQRWEDPLGRVSLVNPHEQATFDRYADTVLDPLSALGHLENGTFTLEHAEAMKAVYPAMYADIQRRVMDAMIEAPEIPFQARVQAGIIFEAPTDASMQPEMIAATQAALGGQDPSQQGPQGQPPQGSAPTVRPSGAPKPASTAVYSTGAGRIESGASRLI